MCRSRRNRCVAAVMAAWIAIAVVMWGQYVAPQCLSTLVVTRRETNSWRWPLLMAAYLFVLAYAAAFVTYRVTLWFGGG